MTFDWQGTMIGFAIGLLVVIHEFDIRIKTLETRNG